ncbi:hypothetical protein [Alteromonas sp. CYL-A6]|uniref:hypothetical protein n=1 Tax=Alteromonas nitratireducens TaxID=3390813 RepID=UPI0034B2EAC8
MLFITVLFVIVLLLLAYSLSGDKGQNTVHARRQTQGTVASPHVQNKPAKTASSLLQANQQF